MAESSAKASSASKREINYGYTSKSQTAVEEEHDELTIGPLAYSSTPPTIIQIPSYVIGLTIQRVALNS